MATMGLGEFLEFVGRKDVFSYNLRSVALNVQDAGRVFDGAVVLDAGAGKRLKHFRDSLPHAKRVIGIDFCRSDLRQNADVEAKVEGDVERLPFRGGCL